MVRPSSEPVKWLVKGKYCLQLEGKQVDVSILLALNRMKNCRLPFLFLIVQLI